MSTKQPSNYRTVGNSALEMAEIVSRSHDDMIVMYNYFVAQSTAVAAYFLLRKRKIALLEEKGKYLGLGR